MHEPDHLSYAADSGSAGTASFPALTRADKDEDAEDMDRHMYHGTVIGIGAEVPMLSVRNGAAIAVCKMG